MLVAGLSVLLLAVAIPGAPAFASQAKTSAVLPESTVVKIRANMAGAGIAPATQDLLLEKLARGEMLDSTLRQNSVSTSRQVLSGSVKTTTVYADGSVSWVTLELATKPKLLTPDATLTGCTTSLGWKVNCKVELADTVSNTSFRIDYQNAPKQPGRVRDYRGAYCFNLLGTCSVSGGIVRAVQSSAGPAWARLNYKANILDVPSVAGEIGIRVSTSASVYG